MRHGWLLLLLLPLGCQPGDTTAQAPPLEVEAERGPFRFLVAITPPNPGVGDPIEVTLHAETPNGHEVEFPGGDSFAPLELIDRTTHPATPLDDNRQRFTQELRLESYLSGEIDIDPLVLRYGRSTADSEVDLDKELGTDSIQFTVRSALTSQDTTQSPRDITGTRMPPVPPWGWQAWTLAVVGTLLGLALLAWLFWQMQQRLFAPPPPIPAEVRAREALRPLREDEWLQPQRMQEYHYKLSEIVRTYVEDQFGLAAPEMTTEEFLRTLTSMRGSRLSARFQRRGDIDRDEWQHLTEHNNSLQQLLEGCDLVKYGSFAPPTQAARENWDQAAAFVDRTAEAVQQHRQRREEAA